MRSSILPLAACLAWHAHASGSSSAEATLEEKWGNDWGFSGISTFAHLPHTRCLTNPDAAFDIGIIGAPFDTSVSFRPGARFGPRAIRASSARQTPFRSFNFRADLNPYTGWARVVDCGDIPVTPFDNALALRQMTEAFLELGPRRRAAATPASGEGQGKAEGEKVRLVTLGGDHSVALPALRALRQIHGRPVAVLHFDAHLDTWHPAKYPSAWEGGETMRGNPQSHFNHGSMFWMAAQEGLVANGSVHAGLRTRLSGGDLGDFEDDSRQGWHRILADEIDEVGTRGVVEEIMARLGTETPVYLSIDIDVVDPGMAPGTGTPEPGGWTSRELIRIVRGVEGLNVVGADVVEVSPSYDDAGDVTSLLAAQLVYEVVTSMVKRGAGSGVGGVETKPGGKDEL